MQNIIYFIGASPILHWMKVQSAEPILFISKLLTGGPASDISRAGQFLIHIATFIKILVFFFTEY